MEASRGEDQVSVGWERSTGVTAVSWWRHHSMVAAFSLWGSLTFLVCARPWQSAPAHGGSSACQDFLSTASLYFTPQKTGNRIWFRENLGLCEALGAGGWGWESGHWWVPVWPCRAQAAGLCRVSKGCSIPRVQPAGVCWLWQSPFQLGKLWCCGFFCWPFWGGFLLKLCSSPKFARAVWERHSRWNLAREQEGSCTGNHSC